MSDPAVIRLHRAFKTIIVLATLSISLALVLVWKWKSTSESRNPGFVFQAANGENLIRKKFPEVDFSQVYPGMAANEIDRLQRESLRLRYVYAPFVEFEPLPTSGRYMNIVPAGYRRGRTTASWPPASDDFVVFVFGGSTTLGFGLPDGDTVVSALEESLQRQFPARHVRCYNFGRGYYFSTQERALFESLLTRGIIPNVALFIDGLNEFVYYNGVPQLTSVLFNFTAPDLDVPSQPEPANDTERAAAVAQLIDRYRRNIRITEGIAQAYGVTAIFVGQPVPFLDFPMTQATYPFRSTFAEHKLSGWGYARFKEAGRQGRFGDRFVWCGNAFVHEDHIMFVDSIHYSADGARVLAQCIVKRAAEVGLWPEK